MRAAAILGLGCSQRDLRPFQDERGVEWRVGMPASGDEADVVLLVGGDGTIHRHLAQLVQLGLPVLVVAAGSGNDFANSIGLGKIKSSLEAWSKFCRGSGEVRDVDLGVISWQESGATQRRYFSCVAGVGLDGEVARRANGLPRWLRGNGGYLASVVPTIFTFAPFPLKVMIPSEGGWTARSDEPSLVAAFANTPLYGGGMNVAPQARMDDGLLDVCVVAGMSPFRLFYMFPTVYAGRHLKIKEVSYYQAGRVRVETEHPMDVYADGEFVCRTPLEVGVAAGALKVVTA